MDEDRRSRHAVLVLGGLAVGGAERQALLLAEYLSRAGWRVTIAALSAEGTASQRFREAGIACRPVPLRYPASLFWSVLNLPWMLFELRRLKPDCLVAYTSVPCTLCGILWRLTGATRFIWNQRSVGLYRPHPALERLALRYTQEFAANSCAVAEFLQSVFDVPPSRVCVIRNGIVLPAPERVRRAARCDLGLRPRDFVGCMVANVRPPKDHRTLIEAWCMLIERMAPSRVRPVLLLAGDLPSASASLARQVVAAGVSDYIRFLGVRSDIADLLNAADLGVFSSRSEGLPNGVLECMAAGLPMVATDLPGIRECLGEEQHPFLVPEGDSTAFAEKMTQLSGDPELRSQLGRVNRARIERAFSVDRMGEAMLELMTKSDDRAVRVTV